MEEAAGAEEGHEGRAAYGAVRWLPFTLGMTPMNRSVNALIDGIAECAGGLLGKMATTPDGCGTRREKGCEEQVQISLSARSAARLPSTLCHHFSHPHFSHPAMASMSRAVCAEDLQPRLLRALLLGAASKHIYRDVCIYIYIWASSQHAGSAEPGHHRLQEHFQRGNYTLSVLPRYTHLEGSPGVRTTASDVPCS